jgi:hypothetical protein
MQFTLSTCASQFAAVLEGQSDIALVHVVVVLPAYITVATLRYVDMQSGAPSANVQ